MKKKAKPSKVDLDLTKSLDNLSKQLAKEGFSLTPEQLKDLKSTVAQELAIHKSIKEIKNSSKNIINYLGEFFDTFILLGYDSKGERVILQLCDSALKEDALAKFLEQTFIKYHRQKNEDL